MAIEYAAALGALKRPLEDLYETSSGKVKEKFAIWKADRHARELFKKLSHVRLVKTMWIVDQPISIESTYYPSKLRIGDNKYQIDSLSQLPQANAIIRGTVGQGKSFFLRYMAWNELKQGSRIPLLITLRNLDSTKGLLPSIEAHLEDMGFKLDADIVNHLLSSGKLVILLDGFDEVDQSYSGKLLVELEAMCGRYPTTQVLITSRPDSGLESSTFFSIYQLAPLEPEDLPKLVKLLCKAKKIEGQDEILTKIKDSRANVKDLLTTPLLVILLLIRYQVTKDIPETFDEFYGDLFQLLLVRHDNHKGNPPKRRKSTPHENDLRKIFDALCFLYRKGGYRDLSGDELHALAVTAVEKSQVRCDAGNFIEDISRVACLLLKDGAKYHFVHRSVADFHAASYVCGRPDENAMMFYQALLNDTRWRSWLGELLFLARIDRFRFLKYFLIPDLKRTMEVVSYPVDHSEVVMNEWATGQLEKFGVEIREERRPDGTPELVGRPVFPTSETYTLHEVNFHVFFQIVSDVHLNLASDKAELLKMSEKKNQPFVSFGALARARGKADLAKASVLRIWQQQLAKHDEFLRFVETEESAVADILNI